MLRKFIQWLLIVSLFILLTSLWRMHILPNPSELSTSLLDEPKQEAIQAAKFETISNGVTYTVQPLYHYDLVGLVVSKHNADTWWDYIHREWNDSLNIVDLCVVWGNNVKTNVYKEINFSSGQFTCNFSTSSDTAFAAFDQTAISNNHLLSDNPRLTKIMRNVQVGDQVHFRGSLAEYSHHHGFAFKRGTSITRTDTGNGACETVFVDSFEIIKSGGKPWRQLVWVSGMLLLFGIIAWFTQPVWFND